MELDTDTCIICYENIGRTKYNTICSCNFFYHEQCYLEWIDINSICLICRKPLTKKMVLETINPIILNKHIREIKAYLEVDEYRPNYIENSNTNNITSSNNSYLLFFFMLISLFILIFIITFIVSI